MNEALEQSFKPAPLVAAPRGIIAPPGMGTNSLEPTIGHRPLEGGSAYFISYRPLQPANYLAFLCFQVSLAEVFLLIDLESIRVSMN